MESQRWTEGRSGNMIELGGNIKLIGFNEMEPAMLIVVKKIVVNYAKKISTTTDLKELSLHVKEVHKTASANQRWELQAKLSTDSKVYAADVTDFNIFFAMDKALSKVMSELAKEKSSPIHDLPSSHEEKE